MALDLPHHDGLEGMHIRLLIRDIDSERRKTRNTLLPRKEPLVFVG